MSRTAPISVVMPTYNRGHLIERALRSILEQDPQPAEVIVVDDGSTDDTAQIVGAVGDVRYVRQDNGGAAVARNHGVELATEDFVAFLDSDDYWLPGHLAALDAARCATDGRASVYFDDCYFSAPGHPVDADQTLWGLADFGPGAPHELCDDPFDWAILPLQPTMLQSSMIATQAYLDAGGLRPELRLRHDTALFFALSAAAPWCAVAHIGTRMTPDADNRLTTALPTSSPEYWVETVSMYAEFLRRSAHRTRSERAEIRSRLATAHWRLGRSAGTRRPIEAARQIGSAVATSPSTMSRTAQSVTRRGRRASVIDSA